MILSCRTISLYRDNKERVYHAMAFWCGIAMDDVRSLELHATMIVRMRYGSAAMESKRFLRTICPSSEVHAWLQRLEHHPSSHRALSSGVRLSTNVCIIRSGNLPKFVARRQLNSSSSLPALWLCLRLSHPESRSLLLVFPSCTALKAGAVRTLGKLPHAGG